jgi:cbb3-type cytochrome oxidase maturation protein
MSILYIMIPTALLIAGGAIWLFIRAALAGQFDDLDTPACRMVTDDDPIAPTRQSGA